MGTRIFYEQSVSPEWDGTDLNGTAVPSTITINKFNNVYITINRNYTLEIMIRKLLLSLLLLPFIV